MPETVSIPAQKAQFLAITPCADWTVSPLAGDASTRSYDRLTGTNDDTAILMDAGPDAAQSIPRFIEIANHLAALGLCPPQIIATGSPLRFLLISDLGDTDVAAWLRTHPQDERPLYEAALDVLNRISAAPPPPGLTHLTPDIGATMLAPFFDHVAPTAHRPAIEGRVQDALARHAGAPDTLSLRDFHAENLIWRPAKHCTNRIGLLDFQDAFVAPAAYDLVSLLRDARRDIASETHAHLMARFADQSGQSLTETEAACAILGVQRNLRILGIFARLAQVAGKRQYLALMPRVTGHIRADLAHPTLAGLAPLIEAALS